MDEIVARLRRDVAELVRPGSRSWRHGAVLASIAARLESVWKGLGYRVERQEIPGMGPDYRNVLAFPEGGSWDSQPLLVAAHYDAVEGTPGADDNASGVAVLLEVSRLLALRGGEAPRPTFALAALTLEEPPFFDTERQGGWVLASSLRQRGVALAGVVVLEMVGYYRSEMGSQSYPFPLGFFGYPRTGDFVGVVGNLRGRGLTRGVAAAIEAAGLPAEMLSVPGKGGLLPAVRLSDHAAFWDLGYSAVMVTDTSFFRNPNYHRPSDRPETLDYRSMARLALGLTQFLQGKEEGGRQR